MATRSTLCRRATEVCGELSRAIAADAEGATHLVTLFVEGLRTEAEARQIAQSRHKPLVKTAIFGAGSQLGRIVSAAGYAGVALKEACNALAWRNLLYKAGVAAL